MWLNVALAEICGSTVEKGGVAGAEFSADVTFSQWFCSLINVCSSLQSLLCLFERNIALQPKIQGNLGDLYEQNDVSVSKVQFRFKVFIPRIPSVFRYRGKSLALINTATTPNTRSEQSSNHKSSAFTAFAPSPQTSTMPSKFYFMPSIHATIQNASSVP